jgi:hypothetical protein
MMKDVLHETLEELAERYIPEGRHKFLHVDSRKAWKELMLVMLKTGIIRRKLSLITKCAVNWETLLVQKLSIQN